MLVRTTFLIAVIALLPISVSADEVTGTQTSYLAWAGAGAMVVNSGVALANGHSLTAGTSSRKNGMFGLVLGSTTMAISVVGLVRAEDDQSKNFSLFLGATGLASAVTGALSIKFSAPQGQQVSVTPLVNPFRFQALREGGPGAQDQLLVLAIQNPCPQVGPLVDHEGIRECRGRGCGPALRQVEYPTAENREAQRDELGLAFSAGEGLFGQPGHEGLQKVFVDAILELPNLL